MEDFDWMEEGWLQRFDQREFISEEDQEITTLAKYGYVFYPDACIGKTCNLAIGMHGCGGSAYDWHLEWSGLACKNEIIVVYP